MTEINIAHVFYWASVGSLGMATVVYAAAIAFSWVKLTRFAWLILLMGLATLTVSITLRWIAVGHGPYLGRYEALGSYAWVLLAVFILLQLQFKGIWRVGAIVAGGTFLFLGAGVLSTSAPQFESPALRSAWLWIHVGMAKLAVAAFVSSAAVSLAHIRISRRVRLATDTNIEAAGDYTYDDNGEDVSDHRLERLAVRLVSLGFLVLAVVIGAGALWANTAWGAYWSWDPIETWALSTWLMYGLLLHAHRMWRLSGARWAVLNATALGSSTALFLIMRYITLSPHWIYLG